MNRYEEKYNFKIASINDVDLIMAFIREHWRSGHVLGTNKEFFLYEHGHGDQVNFVLCIEKESNRLVGIHGFIPYSNEPDFRHVCGVMTMVKKDGVMPLLGVELIKKFISLANYQSYCGIGTNEKTMLPLVKTVFGRSTAKLDHYYMLNESISDFKIAKVSNTPKVPCTYKEVAQAKLQLLKTFKMLSQSFELNKPFSNLPFKAGWYIKKRYFEHPIFRYKVWGISNRGRIEAILVGREVEANKTTILRMVDFIGNIESIRLIQQELRKLIIKNGYEYIDFLLHGINENTMNKAGFLLKNEDEIIIPNYFQPFVRENIDVWCEKSREDMILFKGDADADRPN